MASSVPKVKLHGGLNISRILNGMWQVSGAHGAIDPQKAVQEMQHYLDAGLTTFDMADHYGPAEEFYGVFLKQLRRERGEDSVKSVQGLTKWVPRPGPMTRQIVEQNIDRSLHRMGVEKLDSLQFHWWDYNDKRYLDALGHMADLQNEGKIGELALTNFDTQRMKEISDKGIRISTNQVQYSIIDRRPAVKMAEFCQAHDIKLLTYGTIGGGLISEKYLDVPEPAGRRELNTASLGKYKQMIDAWGGWKLFQELLKVLDGIAKSHNVSIPNVATRYILDQPAVGGVIIGCRLGVKGAEHISDNLRTFTFDLTQSDTEKIEAVCRRSQDLFARIGDCGDEYR
ncbi:uncharacterized protein [Ptychodera flava]|uniref:uncharacterized protein isoform X2 n=2 Tax=Ptychodera flava TaxID=63121 RepID=UPI00396AB13B